MKLTDNEIRDITRYLEERKPLPEKYLFLLFEEKREITRRQNPDDQKYIRGLVSSANSDILDQLPILPQQHAIVMVDCVRTPVQVRINNVAPKPNSDNPRFVEKWLEEQSDFPNYKEICNNWKDGKK